MSIVVKTMAVVLGLYLIGFVLFAANLPAAPAALGKPDAIVALTGGGARLDAAVALFERGVGKRLLISGVAPSTTKKELKLLAHGGARFDCCADLGFQAADTHGNAEETAGWVRAHHYRSIVVVTATYHMPRSLSEFSARMPGVELKPYPVEPEGIDLHEWWRDPRALRVLQGEYAKYLASAVLTHVFTS
jgi:uncharacterized SAM-binding protein YcdF (DUF218 family)